MAVKDGRGEDRDGVVYWTGGDVERIEEGRLKGCGACGRREKNGRFRNGLKVVCGVKEERNVGRWLRKE